MYDDEFDMRASEDDAYAGDAYQTNINSVGGPAGNGRGTNSDFARGEIVYDDVNIGGEEFGNGMSSPPKYDFDESAHLKKTQNQNVRVPVAAEDDDDDDDDVAWA